MCIDALPAKYEVEPRNLTSGDGMGRDGTNAVRERHHRRSGNQKKGSNAGRAGHAVLDGGGGGAHGKGGGRGKGRGGRRGQQERGGKGTDEDGGGSASTAGGDGSSTKAAEGSTSEVRYYRWGKKDHWRADCTEELCSQCHGQGHAADVCPSSKKQAVLPASKGDGDSDTAEALAFKAEKMAVEGNDGLGKMGEWESV